MPTNDSTDPRSAQAFTPAPQPSEELAKLKAEHKELYDAYVAHVAAGYENNARIFDNILRAFLRSHNFTVAMYWILFLLGAATVATGVVLAVQGNAATGAMFLGVGIVAFVTYFIGRSSQSVEENLLYITWLGMIYNSYWTHQAWATERETAQLDLDKATSDSIKRVERLIDRHAESVRARPGFGRLRKPAATQASTAGEQG